ncbi:MAG: glycerol-3-phosphate acyltransferase [Acidobacteria bacterium]|nr:glycerol-3-phosphate acyltransferase [Acidobacteriota bacterium]
MSVAAAIGATIVGYLIGSSPTAEWLGRLAGVDLRKEGSMNPGTNNALRVGGPPLAAAVLAMEMAKGAIAVIAGAALAGDLGAVLAGVGATTGNVFNMYYRFQGGKGLGISAGILTAIWPTVLAPVIAVILITVLITRSAGASAIVTIVAFNLMAILWATLEWPMAWGIEATSQLLVLSVGMGAVLWNRHWSASPFSRRHRRSLQESA